MIGFSPFYFVFEESWFLMDFIYMYHSKTVFKFIIFIFINEKTMCAMANHSIIIYLIYICSNLTTNTMLLRWKLVTNAYSSTTIQVLNCLLTQRKAERGDDDDDSI